MFWSKRMVALTIAATSVVLAGYDRIESKSSAHESSALAKGPQTLEHASPNAPSASNAGRMFDSRSAERDVSRAVYSNPEQGFSFRYPRSYALEEGEIEEHTYFLRRQDELEPGTTLAATLLIPDDAYPNTAFAHGSLQLVITENISQESCRASAQPLSGDSQEPAVHEMTLDNVAFWWSEEKSTIDETQIVERHYAGLANDRCYEFFAVVAVGEQADPGTAVRPADAEKIVHKLEKVLGSLQLVEPSTSAEPFSRAANDPHL